MIPWPGAMNTIERISYQDCAEEPFKLQNSIACLLSFRLPPVLFPVRTMLHHNIKCELYVQRVHISL